jgi:lipoprotein-anchoring transpeptidase ErfK/SrfK
MTKTHQIGRRSFMLGAASLALAGCTTTKTSLSSTKEPNSIPEEIRAMYASMPHERFPIPAVQIGLVDRIYWRQEVDNITGEKAGVVVVDTPNRFLYWTMDNGRAMRYGVGIGREGFAWSGRGHIAYGREWPTWTPPSEMIARDPSLEKYRNGMEPGLKNPLGARALYIHKGNIDTLYRLHGTMEVHSIGKAVSSGCVRLLHQDVIDLYTRVKWGAPIVVIQ